MFTGIVEATGQVLAFTRRARGWRLRLAAAPVAAGTAVGDSIAVNGCCLTVAARAGGRLEFDVLEQTRRLTNFSALRPGAGVNLERSLRADGRIGGHFVTGHVDGLGKIIRWEKSGTDHVLEIAALPAVLRYVVKKGSIAVDGISLTVAGVGRRSFRIWIIPHTFAVTALSERSVGDAVNLEADLLGKYVERFLSRRWKK